MKGVFSDEMTSLTDDEIAADFLTDDMEPPFIMRTGDPCHLFE